MVSERIDEDLMSRTTSPYCRPNSTTESTNSSCFPPERCRDRLVGRRVDQRLIGVDVGDAMDLRHRPTERLEETQDRVEVVDVGPVEVRDVRGRPRRRADPHRRAPCSRATGRSTPEALAARRPCDARGAGSSLDCLPRRAVQTLHVATQSEAAVVALDRRELVEQRNSSLEPRRLEDLEERALGVGEGEGEGPGVLLRSEALDLHRVAARNFSRNAAASRTASSPNAPWKMLAMKASRCSGPSPLIKPTTLGTLVIRARSNASARFR